MRLVCCFTVVVFMSVALLHVATERSESGYVDHSASGIVALWGEGSLNPYALDENGIAWEIDQPSGWRVASEIPPIPVPVSEVKLWTPYVFITYSNHAWRRDNTATEWVDMGLWPGSGSTIENESWGVIKAGYR